ncbi:hypothetical protein [Arsenophonus endosymbiont of Aleurodicus floccissimus]|uniref:hypothetical protein n=1 Tax=Arsenophonus endosymbiont of Aleurodicus floccissimus TaxID=2152761 RepID=UPI001602C63D|nr:hypothetical protein [Arsenophonus endosymbiont of Aleurodicus floccissimus]
MANGFRFERSWAQGIWYALRHATGVDSPQNFEVNQYPSSQKNAKKFITSPMALKKRSMRQRNRQ